MVNNYRDMVPYYHNHGGDSCGGVAFNVNRVSVSPGAPIYAQDVEYDDGIAPDAGNIIICQKCNTRVYLTIEDIGGKARLARKIEDDANRRFEQ